MSFNEILILILILFILAAVSAWFIHHLTIAHWQHQKEMKELDIKGKSRADISAILKAASSAAAYELTESMSGHLHDDAPGTDKQPPAEPPAETPVPKN
jgi:hypothetical protein